MTSPTAWIEKTSAEQKFIVASVEEGGTTKVIVSACAPQFGFNGHSDIYHGVAMGYKSSDCIGGGFLRRDDEKKTIALWGHSVTFGYGPDRALTVRLLQEAYPDYKVTAR